MGNIFDPTDGSQYISLRSDSVNDSFYSLAIISYCSALLINSENDLQSAARRYQHRTAVAASLQATKNNNRKRKKINFPHYKLKFIHLI